MYLYSTDILAPAELLVDMKRDNTKFNSILFVRVIPDTLVARKIRDQTIGSWAGYT